MATASPIAKIRAKNSASKQHQILLISELPVLTKVFSFADKTPQPARQVLCRRLDRIQKGVKIKAFKSLKDWEGWDGYCERARIKLQGVLEEKLAHNWQRKMDTEQDRRESKHSDVLGSANRRSFDTKSQSLTKRPLVKPEKLAKYKSGTSCSATKIIRVEHLESDWKQRQSLPNGLSGHRPSVSCFTSKTVGSISSGFNILQDDLFSYGMRLR